MLRTWLVNTNYPFLIAMRIPSSRVDGDRRELLLVQVTQWPLPMASNAHGKLELLAKCVYCPQLRVCRVDEFTEARFPKALSAPGPSAL